MLHLNYSKVIAGKKYDNIKRVYCKNLSTLKTVVDSAKSFINDRLFHLIKSTFITNFIIAILIAFI